MTKINKFLGLFFVLCLSTQLLGQTTRTGRDVSNMVFNPHSDFDVLDANQREIRVDASGSATQVEIVSSGGGMYEIHLYDNGVKRDGSFRVSQVWAHRAINFDHAKRLNEILNSVADTGSAPMSDCEHCLHADSQESPQADPISGEACEFYDRFKQSGIDEKPLKQALLFYQKNRKSFPNEKWLSVADYSLRSDKKRFYMLNMQTGEVIREKVSHGSGHQNGKKKGDLRHDGHLDKCHDNGNRTNMTRPGFFKTAEFYRSTSHTDMKNYNGRKMREWPFIDASNRTNAMRLDGLSPGINDHARRRGVVMHGAWYNDIMSIMGRSYGCPAFESDKAPEVLNRIKDGSLFYAFTPQCSDDQRQIDRQVEGWEGMCED